MIRGIHGLFYSSDPDATRQFFKDKVKLPGSDIGGGWWIFDFGEGDLGVHPVDDPADAGNHDGIVSSLAMRKPITSIREAIVRGPLQSQSGRTTSVGW